MSAPSPSAKHFDTLLDIYRTSIRDFPDRDLFGVRKGGSWTWTKYAEFGRQVERFRAGLAGLGIGKGDRVAVISNNRIEWAVAAYACFGLGAAYVPMYEAQKEEEWGFIVGDCEAKMVLAASKEILEKCRPFLKTIPSLKHIVSFEGSATDDLGEGATTYAKLLETKNDVPMAAATKDDVACLIYTSGTTGNPKGVILSHGNIASNVQAIHDVFPMSNDDRSLSFLPWAHSFGQTVELHGLFSMGGQLAICDDVSKILDYLGETQPTLLFSVPRIFNRLYAAVQKQISSKPGFVQALAKVAFRVRKKQRDGEAVGVGEGMLTSLADKIIFSKVRARFGGRLKYAFSGGAAISRDVAEFIDGLGITVYEGYGLTETSPIATANWPNSRKIGSVGKPIPGVTIEIVAGDGPPKDGGKVEGEIVVYGPNVMVGYHNRKEENDAVFTAPDAAGRRGFRTGDMGTKDKDGFLYITGRIKEQYKLENGKYVVPTPLEEQIKLSPFIVNAMVYGDNKPYNVALIVANADAVRDWAGKNGVTLAGDAWLKEPKVRELFKKELASAAEHFKGFEEVRDFALIDKDFTTENGMLTPSLKLKRRKVMEVHGALIEALYAQAKKARPAATATGS